MCICRKSAASWEWGRTEEDNGRNLNYSNILGAFLGMCLYEKWDPSVSCSFYRTSFYGKIAPGLTGFMMSFLRDSWNYRFCCFYKLFNKYQYLSLGKHTRVGIGSLSFGFVSILIRGIHCWCLSPNVSKAWKLSYNKVRELWFW